MLRRMFAQTGDRALKVFRQLCLFPAVTGEYRHTNTHTCAQTCSVFSHDVFNVPGHHVFGCTSIPTHTKKNVQKTD